MFYRRQHIWKKIIALVILAITLFRSYPASAEYVCQPPFNGNRTVEADCTFPDGDIKVYGDVTVADKVITVPPWVTFWIDLTTNNVTFTTGKVNFQGTGKMDDTVSGRIFITLSYTSTSWTVACPAGYAVTNSAGTAFQWGTSTNVPASGTITCGKT